VVSFGRIVAAAMLATLVLCAPAAGQGGAPLRFGLGRAAANMHHGLGSPVGFVAWMTLPVSRTSWIGIRGEFAVLAVPEERIEIISDGSSAVLGLQNTVTFTGVGPRVEYPLGPAIVGGAVMAGLSRAIIDVTGRASVDEQVHSLAVSSSENSLGVKVSGDIHLPLYHGRGGAALGLAGGIDWTTSGRIPFPRPGSFRLVGSDLLEVDAPETAIRMWGWRIGLGVVF
jgi:hypothetical protein